jgi:hypothetical protein
MPYDIKRNYGGCKGYAVVGPSGTKGCHPSRKEAIEQQRALYAAEADSKKMEHNDVITNEDTPNKNPHSIEECQDPQNCPDHMAMHHDMDKAESVRVGQMVSWNSSGGRAEGKVIRIIRNGKYNVPNSSFTITGTPEDPAVAIRLYRDGKETDTIVGHKMKTLTVKKSYDEDEDLEKKSPCWEGYVQRGMKPGEGGQMVPNCVPARKNIVDQIRSLF